MNNIVNELVMPTHVQCALDGRWEEALLINKQSLLPPKEEFDAWLGGKTNFALEVFFCMPHRRVMFVGVRWMNRLPEELYEAVSSVVQLMEHRQASGKATYPTHFFEESLSVRLLTDAPSYLEIGVNNFWQSVGSCVIWNAGEPPADTQGAISRVSALAPQLLKPQPSNVILNVAYKNPISHWAGVEISQETNGAFSFDEELLNDYLGALNDEPF
ncbi:hypothetical protein [Ensifer sp. Root127]|uniref:hypothetical protein n=1 Tax=Ensifer sp. Root127 TaxID=1736440 RepID=UPI00070D9361|nr:hypothetical protein [Ensifer sp. Root127]KQW60737.1 hypothetical protein ASD03_36840 [Ensifer sp. Root127]